MNTRTIELLAPARDLACGRAAIDHGADAVYIGGPRFGARSAAGNSLDDIARLIEDAHPFRVKVYVALNTLLDDAELDEAVALCHSLCDLGVDGLIIQDLGLLEADLPPIPLHASTQLNNRTPEKVRFLEGAGFSQVVLARELSLAEIRAIRAATAVPLEFFVHGALCVAYSGQCYISEVMAGRSANRGRCAQFCRHSFDLLDARGKVLCRDRHLLSLKDLDLSTQLEPLIDAGISSLKIEGRLKDAHYVKNITAAYRQSLDALFARRGDLTRASAGRCRFAFSPEPGRSFHRGSTTYFLEGRDEAMAEPRTPKSIGTVIGRVCSVDERSFTFSGEATVANGDGLCFFDARGDLVGLRVNRVEGRTIYPRDPVGKLGLRPGMELHRNLDAQLNRQLEASRRCRTIEVDLALEETDCGLRLSVVDEEGLRSSSEIAVAKAVADKPGALAAVARRQLSKSGETVFTVRRVEVDLSQGLFVPASLLNDLRRRTFDRHLELRRAAHVPPRRRISANAVPWISKTLDYQDNITNRKALAFYRRHGVAAEELPVSAAEAAGCALMTTRYCLRAQLGLCPRTSGRRGLTAEPLILADRSGRYQVRFHCGCCEMTLHRLEEDPIW